LKLLPRSKPFPLSELGFTLTISPECERELEELRQHNALAAWRVRNFVFGAKP
jgi:hypothetical protein